MHLLRVGSLALVLLAACAWMVLGSITPAERAPSPATSASVAPRP